MKKEEKANLIKILPKTWSSGQLAKETGIPLNLKCEARNNSLKIIRKQRSDKMTEGLKEKITNFYLSDRISKVMPGTKISVKGADGKREHHCKQLLFHHVYEVYNKFIEMHPDDKVSLSQFRKLRPGQVVLVGAPGTHQTCKVSKLTVNLLYVIIVLLLQCIICENPSLLVESTELGELSTFKELVKPQEQVRMRNLVHNIVCDEDGDHCRLSSRKHKRFSCTDCKEKERIFREVLLKKFHDEGIESVNFIQ